MYKSASKFQKKHTRSCRYPSYKLTREDWARIRTVTPSKVTKGNRSRLATPCEADPVTDIQCISCKYSVRSDQMTVHKKKYCPKSK